MARVDDITAADINLLAEFMSDAQLQDLSPASTKPVDCIVICASAVLDQATTLFAALTRRPSLAKYLVLCGGIGHSTQLLYEAVRCHERYSKIYNEIEGLPEARVLERILDKFFDRAAITAQGCQILIEDRSTNCGQNASFTRQVLDDSAVYDMKTCIIVQDPTMMLRTKATFEKTYEGGPCNVLFTSCPVIVPRVQVNSNGCLVYSSTVDCPSRLWKHQRFLELILGEIPRLRDDEQGYGPKGRGFIAHVDIPAAVEEAWLRLVSTVGDSRQIK
ncbi:hypothetical protein N7509_001612 [Penicillium cosmopolitanum]|uniref:DUF218 domain-containing protein n=1 Tax=Penicillium cosmopolitanum TaxID=1131564 RepID=A0A9X0BCN8_9EURO|nr:uncharacterized protein N7509_001612 [Penicillium cosmopolitanum]KAJ5407729.1 hypothetical protein N7509_001612 [Penicillium cosmopolitanum]